MGGRWEKSLFGTCSGLVALEGQRIEWMVIKFQNPESQFLIWESQLIMGVRRYGIGYSELLTQEEVGFSSIFSFQALRGTSFQSLSCQFFIHRCAYMGLSAWWVTKRGSLTPHRTVMYVCSNHRSGQQRLLCKPRELPFLCCLACVIFVFMCWALYKMPFCFQLSFDHWVRSIWILIISCASAILVLEI